MQHSTPDRGYQPEWGSTSTPRAPPRTPLREEEGEDYCQERHPDDIDRNLITPSKPHACSLFTAARRCHDCRRWGGTLDSMLLLRYRLILFSIAGACGTCDAGACAGQTMSEPEEGVSRFVRDTPPADAFLLSRAAILFAGVRLGISGRTGRVC